MLTKNKRVKRSGYKGISKPLSQQPFNTDGRKILFQKGLRREDTVRMVSSYTGEGRFDNNLIEKARGYLMLGDNPAVYFDFADSIVSMVDNRLAPFALRNRIQGSNEIKAIVGNLERFRSYLSSRILTLHRDNAKNILNVLRMPQGQDTRTKTNIALNCKALSLTDGYWIKFDGINVCPESIPDSRNYWQVRQHNV